MGKEFIDIARLDASYRRGRLDDFKDVEKRPSENEVRCQASRCMSCGIPFCHGFACPLANAIPEINDAVGRGNVFEAYSLLAETSPFPEFTSRVCPALCESACVSNLPSAAVTIKQIEYFTIERAFKLGFVKPRIASVKTGCRVAVIGAGPAGLAAAHELNRYGYEVTVFEKKRFAGGLLRYGIPDFKLEKNIVERRINIMRESGVVFEFGIEVGVDISANYIRKKFDALCLCIGCETPRDLNIEGRNLNGVHFALDYLFSQNRFNSGESSKLEISAKNKSVLIIGGGDTGSDCLGTALRQGAKNVTQIEIMPEPPEGRHTSTPWPQWEYKKRTSSSHLEGGTRMWSVLTKSFAGDKVGDVKKVRAALADWQFDGAGRPLKFSERANSDFEIDADLVLLSMGFTNVASPKLVAELNLPLSTRGVADVDSGFNSKISGIFSCGDAALGASLVVRAIASGKKMAKSVDKHLRKKV